jgi:hypothetical protein
LQIGWCNPYVFATQKKVAVQAYFMMTTWIRYLLWTCGKNEFFFQPCKWKIKTEDLQIRRCENETWGWWIRRGGVYMFYCLIFVEPIVNSPSVYEDCVHHAELILSLVFQEKRSDQCLNYWYRQDYQPSCYHCKVYKNKLSLIVIDSFNTS